EDRAPRCGRIEPHRVEQPREGRVLHGKRSGQRLVRVHVRRNRLDASARPSANDADARGRRDRELVAEALENAALGGVWACAPLGREPPRSFISFFSQMPEYTYIPTL